MQYVEWHYPVPCIFYFGMNMIVDACYATSHKLLIIYNIYMLGIIIFCFLVPCQVGNHSHPGVESSPVLYTVCIIT